MKVNYYEVLGVERSATETEIRDRFRKLAREQHPDRYRGPDKAEAERRFQTLTEAVNVLSNPERRRQHDATIQSGAARPTDPVQVAKVYVSYGVKAFREGDFTTARDNFDMATKHNPQDGKAWHYLALACARIPSSMRQAVQAIEAAVQREPYNPVYLKDAGQLCARVGLLAKSERYLEEALQWDRDNDDLKAALQQVRDAKSRKRT